MDEFGFPGVIGAIDCTHIAIESPPGNDNIFPGLAFLNRKGYYSLNVQLVCDANLKKNSINARYPGSVHDSTIWAMSHMKEYLKDRYQAGNPCGLFLGDSGYPLQPWLLTPLLDAANDSPEEHYNKLHCSTRNVVKRCNGVLKQRFRCLAKHRVLRYKPHGAGAIVNASAVLHNILVSRNVRLQVDEQAVFHDDNMGNDEGGKTIRKCSDYS